MFPKLESDTGVNLSFRELFIPMLASNIKIMRLKNMNDFFKSVNNWTTGRKENQRRLRIRDYW